LGGTAVAAGATIPALSLSSLVYTAPTTGTSATFTFQVQDNGGTANSGVDLDATPRMMTFSLFPTTPPANHAPAGTDNTVSTLEDTAYVFTTGSFGFSDPLDNPANALNAVKVTTLPSAAAGTLTDGGAAVTLGQFIPVSDITGGLLKFVPVA